MNDEDIIARLQPVFSDVFDETRPTVHSALTSEDVAEWDSLSHVLLIVAVEKEFGIRFPSGAVEDMKHVGDMIRRIAEYADGSTKQ